MTNKKWVWEGNHFIQKKCPICKKKFRTYISQDIKTCSKKCAGKFKTKQFYKKAKRNCKICGKAFIPKHTVRIGDLKHGLYCSAKCRGWGGRKPFIYRSGYKYLLLPDHPFANKQGYYQEHKYILEQKLNRIINPKETVHHINHKRDDNRIENLIIMTIHDHRSFHTKRYPRKNGKFASFRLL